MAAGYARADSTEFRTYTYTHSLLYWGQIKWDFKFADVSVEELRGVGGGSKRTQNSGERQCTASKVLKSKFIENCACKCARCGWGVRGNSPAKRAPQAVAATPITMRVLPQLEHSHIASRSRTMFVYGVRVLAVRIVRPSHPSGPPIDLASNLVRLAPQQTTDKRIKWHSISI